MALEYDSMQYFEKNVVRGLREWTQFNNASVEGDYIRISSGGYAGVELSNDYNNGLKASNYRSLNVSISVVPEDAFNYENYLEVMIKAVYQDNNGNYVMAHYSINATVLDSEYDDEDDSLSFYRVIQMEKYNLVTATLYVINHTEDDVRLNSCVMYRSMDVNSSQIGEAIGFSVSLREVRAYLDGCELFYDGIEEPDKLWWMEDEQGNFNGVNVNNERIISFSRINEILID